MLISDIIYEIDAGRDIFIDKFEKSKTELKSITEKGSSVC